MTAGDAALQDEFLDGVREEIERSLEQNPDRWITVKQLARCHARLYAEEKARRAEAKILTPPGLTLASFIAQQTDMSADLVDSLSTELLNFEMEDISTIFAGIDSRGPHIFVAENDEVDCHDSVGFAAIGIGEWHSSSQLMFAGQSRSKWFPDTILNVYTAKKRAEVAPGVGRGTDMYAVFGLGNSTPITEEESEVFEQIYQGILQKEKEAIREARTHCENYIQAIVAASAAKQQTLPEDQGSSPSIDGKEIADEPKKDENKEIGNA